MPQIAINTNDRISLRISSEDKSLLMRAASLQNNNLTEFVVRHAIALAKNVIKENERMRLTESETLQVMELLDNPPEPNEKLIRTAMTLPKS